MYYTVASLAEGGRIVKILIADDEQIVRNGLKYTIDWKDYDMEILDTVSNGRKAMEVCEKEVPDVVITDIRMPVMDGLELTKELLKKYPDIQIIILSAYDDFKYAQEALHSGAAEYILKAELDCDNLLALLLKLKEKIQEKQSEHQRLRTLDSYLEQLKENLFIRLLTAKCYETEIVRNMEELEIGLKKENLILIHIFPRVQEKKVDVTALAREQMETFLWMDSSCRHWIVLGNVENVCINERKKFLDTIWNTSGGVVYGSAVFSGFNQVLEMQKEMEKIIEIYNFYKKKGAVLCEEIEVNYREINTSAFFTEFIQQMEGNHIEKAKLLIHELFSELKKEYCRPEEIYKTISLIYTFLEEKAGIEKQEKRDITIRKKECLDELLESANEYFQELFEKIRENAFSKDSIIGKSIVYMQEHLEQEVTLQKVAEEVYCSPQYLSYLFKKVTGENFSEYMTRLRIKRAQNLLITTDYSIADIAGRVGIGNPSYFTKVFAKITGTTPNRYRK